MPKSELGAFLRARRAAVSPEDAGIAANGRRRVPGLRREEVAQLVGLSTDYYVRLEQGRGGHPSPSVIGAISRVLQLTPAESDHLADLARAPDPSKVRPPRPPIPVAGPMLQRLLDGMDLPAMIITNCTQVVAWNALCARLLTPFGELDSEQRNMARLLFTDTELAARHRDWATSARETVGILRMTAGREPDNVRLRELVGELGVGSDEFRRLWAEHHVHEKTSGVKQLAHPEVGDFELRYEALRVAGNTDLTMLVYTAEPATPSADALALLRTLVADEFPASPASVPNSSA